LQFLVFKKLIEYTFSQFYKFNFIPVIFSVKGANLVEPFDAFFKAAKRTSPAIIATPPPINAKAVKVDVKRKIAENNLFMDDSLPLNLKHLI
jgi:hypothetical protein